MSYILYFDYGNEYTKNISRTKQVASNSLSVKLILLLMKYYIKRRP